MRISPFVCDASIAEQTLRHLGYRVFYIASGRPQFLDDVARIDRLYRGPRQQLDAAIDERLTALLNHSFTTVPYYHAFKPRGSSLPPAAMLSELPLLTKDIIRRETPRLRSERPGEKVRWNTSGGSTGEPVRLLQDRRMSRAVTVNKALFMRWLGFRPGEPHLLIWGQPEDTFGQRLPFRERVYRTIHNQTYLNCHGISEQVLRLWATWIGRHSPSIIEAYADAIRDLSRYVLANGITLPAPRGIISSQGILTSEMRGLIGEALRAPILNRYGSREVGDIGCSCLEQDAVHISELECLVEVVDDSGRACDPGVEGDILVTLLSNYTMPLLRYRIDDRGVWTDERCSCGMVTRRLSNVVGRRNDYLLALNGTQISGAALNSLLYSVRGIRRYQFRQTEEGVMLTIIPVAPSADATLRSEITTVLERTRQLLGGIPVTFAIVDEIPVSRSGKYRYIHNDLQR